MQEKNDSVGRQYIVEINHDQCIIKLGKVRAVEFVGVARDLWFSRTSNSV